MTNMASFIAALKAIALGSLVGVSIPSLATLYAGGSMLLAGSESPLGALLIIAFPFLIAAALGSLGFLVVGVPMTLILRSKGAENGNNYFLGGAIAGGGVPAVLMLTTAGVGFSILIIGFLGLVTGGAIGHFWWRFGRKPIVEAGGEDVAEAFR